MKAFFCLQIVGTDNENMGYIAIKDAEILRFGTNE